MLDLEGLSTMAETTLLLLALEEEELVSFCFSLRSVSRSRYPCQGDNLMKLR